MKKMQSLLAVATLLLGSLAANAQGVAPITTSCEDITVAKLHEADNFARTDETNDGDRFGAPKYWTVENSDLVMRPVLTMSPAPTVSTSKTGGMTTQVLAMTSTMHASTSR